MSRYDGLIIPRSYSEYINKTDAATLSQALQLAGVLAQQVTAGNNAAVTSNAVNAALTDFYNKQYVDGIVANKIPKLVTLSWDGGPVTPFVPFTTAILDLSGCNHIYAVTPRDKGGGQYADRCLPMVVGMTAQPKKYYIGAYSNYTYNNPFNNVNVYCDILYD